MRQNQDQDDNTLNQTLKQVKEIIDTNTVVGKQIITNDGTIIIPISKVIVGYVGGSGEYFDIKVKKNEKPFANGCGTGAYIKPIGFLSINKTGNTNLIEIEDDIKLKDVMNYFESIIKVLKGVNN